MSFNLWPTVKLGTLATFQEGYVNPSQRKSAYFDGEIKWLRATDLNDGIVSTTSRTLSTQGFQSAGKSALLFEPGTLAISKSGTIGRLGILADRMCGNRAVINIKPNLGVHPRYLFFVLRHLRSTIETLAEGSVQKNLYVSALSNLDIPLLSRSAQEVLVGSLGAIDDRITLLRETNATLEAIAQALFKSWFVDFDPVRAKQEGREPEGMNEATAALFPDGFEESELGLVPRGWRFGRLGDVATLNPESWSAKNHPESVSYVDLANVKDNQIADITEYPFDEAPSRARRVLRDGDTIVGTVRPGNRSFAYIHQPTHGLTGSTGFAVLRPSCSENREFLFIGATRDASIEHLAHVADGAAYPAVRPEIVVCLECVVPTKEVMNAFHQVAAPLLRSVGENEKRARTLAELRDALLPRLVSGQLRLPEAEALVA